MSSSSSVDFARVVTIVENFEIRNTALYQPWVSYRINVMFHYTCHNNLIVINTNVRIEWMDYGEIGYLIYRHK